MNGTEEGSGRSDPAGCAVCDRIEKSAGDALLRRDGWVALGSGERPGWVTFALIRHGNWSWDLHPEEAVAMGDALRQTTDAIRRCTDVERVYVMGFGEQTEHFHLLLVPRLPSLNADVKAALKSVVLPDGLAPPEVNRLLRKELQR